LGSERRTVHAIDSSTVVRLRANQKRCALLGKGYCQRAQRAVQANLVAALTTVVLIRGVRVGVVRRTRFGATCQGAVAQVFADLPESPGKRLFSVDAGIATIEQFQAATEREALVGRLRKYVALRRAPKCASAKQALLDMALAQARRLAPCPSPPSAQAGAGARRCMGQCCIRGRSGQRNARMRT
jgi:hypothetical protein